MQELEISVKDFFWRLSKMGLLFILLITISFILYWFQQQEELKNKVKSDDYFNVIIKKEEMEQFFYNSILDLSYIIQLGKEFLEEGNERYYKEIRDFIHLKPFYKSVTIINKENKKWKIDHSGMKSVNTVHSFDKSLLEKKSIIISPVKSSTEEFPFIHFYTRIPLDINKKITGWSILKFDFKDVYKLIEKIVISNLGQIILLDPQTGKIFTPSDIEIKKDKTISSHMAIDKVFPKLKDDIINNESNQLNTSHGLITYDTFYFFSIDHLEATNKAKMFLGREDVTISFAPLKMISLVPINVLKEFLYKDLKKIILMYLLSIFLSSLFSYIYLKIKVKQEKTERISNIFGKYIDPKIAGEILTQDSDSTLEGKNIQAAILFSDIRKFTSLSEHYSAKDIVQMLNIYFGSFVETIHAQEGILDKFIGDAVMAVFTETPNALDPCERAVKTALIMKENLITINNKLKRKKLPLIKNGIGIHFGEVISGNIGSPDRLEYTVIGDTVNTAARLESANKDLRTSVLISKMVYNRLSATIKTKFKSEGLKTFKGKEEKTEVFNLIS
ncbi:MAG: adenylate/guanylate cyclase domain-containing protein [Halobacteriovoraceae bacterium]|nr:adenylate/guanylate cyclase domain-containing protein [Halobacteriovoraceae bacterium]